jgi:DNA transposition AAA+ family ATPase
MNDTPNATWTAPGLTPAAGGAGRSDTDIELWRGLVEEVRTLAARHDWSKAEVARRANMAEGTFSQWYSGNYGGRLDTQNLKIRQWIDQVGEMSAVSAGMQAAPGYLETRISKEILRTFSYAQQLASMAIITLAAGMGKTMTARHYCATRPHAYLATMSPHTRTPHGMLIELAAALGVTQKDPAKLHRAIGAKLQRNGKQCLLIVDEAQNLIDTAVDQLRSLVDLHECGVVLLGNDEFYGRYTRRDSDERGHSFAQIKRRISIRIRKLSPYPEDVEALIDAWGIEEPGSRKFLTGVGMKPGALGQIDQTLRLASMVAGTDRPTEKHIREAWKNRAVED